MKARRSTWSLPLGILISLLLLLLLLVSMSSTDSGCSFSMLNSQNKLSTSRSKSNAPDPSGAPGKLVEYRNACGCAVMALFAWHPTPDGDWIWAPKSVTYNRSICCRLPHLELDKTFEGLDNDAVMETAPGGHGLLNALPSS